jgi:hypothetical protein
LTIDSFSRTTNTRVRVVKKNYRLQGIFAFARRARAGVELRRNPAGAVLAHTPAKAAIVKSYCGIRRAYRATAPQVPAGVCSAATP